MRIKKDIKEKVELEVCLGSFFFFFLRGVNIVFVVDDIVFFIREENKEGRDT